jgi:hypothetical protein
MAKLEGRSAKVGRWRGVQLALQFRQRHDDETRLANTGDSGTAASGRLQQGHTGDALFVAEGRTSV